MLELLFVLALLLLAGSACFACGGGGGRFFFGGRGGGHLCIVLKVRMYVAAIWICDSLAIVSAN